MTSRPRRPARALGPLLALLVLLSGACSSDESTAPPDDQPASTPSTTGADGGPQTGPPDLPAALELRPLHVAAGERPRIVDDRGREVLLRGVNVNSLGEYHQADPDLAPTVDLTDADWEEMAALGFDVVRLIVSWSRLEPTRGSLDAEYVAEIGAALDQAEANGIYVVLDMHQDAWSATLATPPDHECPDGLEPAIGWDGAPAWATITDGAETCRNPGSRESAAAVRTAFQSFFDDRDGIRRALAGTWGRLAAAFADRPVVAGYDLLNEPNGVESLAVQQPKYTAFLDDAITAIRAAEAEAPGGFPHLLFVEPIVLFPLPDSVPPPGFTDDPDVVFAPHNYWEAITSGLFTIEEGFDLDRRAADPLGAPFWVGEYGWWDTGEETQARLRRYAAAEDQALVGGAWWQWRQACGDPHSVGSPGGTPGDQYHLHTMRCPDEVDDGLTPEFAVVLARAYPRAAPGTLTSLVSDADARTLTLTGRSGDGGAGPLVVWVPDWDRGQPVVGGTGLADVDVVERPGGWIVTATADCTYRLEIDGSDAVEPPATPC